MEQQNVWDEVTAANVNSLVSMCHVASSNAGWWVDKDGNDIRDNPFCYAAKLALVHSEASESLEGDRKGQMDDHLPHRPMREVELADLLIRVFDLAGAYNMDVGGALVEKLAYNKQRQDHKKENREAAGGKSY